MFYMDIRYDGKDPETMDLELTDKPDVALGKLGILSTLIEWHFEDPVSDREIQRNNRIEELQGNRNPFVDKPILVENVFLEKRSSELSN